VLIVPVGAGLKSALPVPIGAQTRGPRLLRQGGLETRPYMNLNPFATSRRQSLDALLVRAITDQGLKKKAQ